MRLLSHNVAMCTIRALKCRLHPPPSPNVLCTNCMSIVPVQLAIISTQSSDEKDQTRIHHENTIFGRNECVTMWVVESGRMLFIRCCFMFLCVCLLLFFFLFFFWVCYFTTILFSSAPFMNMWLRIGSFSSFSTFTSLIRNYDYDS